MAVAFELIYEVEDDSGDVATTTVKVPTGFSLTQYGEFGAALATALDAILAGKVIGADICTNVDVSAIVGNSATQDSDVEEVGSFQFATSEGRKVNVNLPTFDEVNHVAAGTDDIDQANGNVTNFISAMENGLATTGGTIAPCDVGEDDIDTVVFAREKFRSSGRRR